MSTLAVRWVVEHEDVRIADLLVVTFTIATAAELRSRIRARLAEVRDLLRGARDASGDEFLVALARSADPARALDRAERALAEFDTATISTIHGFASSWLGERRGGVGPGEERRRQAVADVLASSAFDESTALFDAPKLSDQWFDQTVGLALGNPDLRLTPFDDAATDAPARAHRDAVQRAVELFETRGRREGARTYADLLADFAAAIAEEDAPVLRALRRRFTVGLIDEFQDTDPTQWQIFERLFLGAPGQRSSLSATPSRPSTASAAATSRPTSTRRPSPPTPRHRASASRASHVNYRSDGVLLEALNGLLEGAHLDESGRIAYQAVTAAPGHQTRRLVHADGTAAVPLSIRVPTEELPIAARRRAIAADCADEAVRALGATVDGVDGARRTVTEDDVVVLCESSTQFALLREAFLAPRAAHDRDALRRRRAHLRRRSTSRSRSGRCATPAMPGRSPPSRTRGSAWRRATTRRVLFGPDSRAGERRSRPAASWRSRAP